MNTQTRMRKDNSIVVDVNDKLESIESKLDEIKETLGSKAERHELEALRGIVEEIRRDGSSHARDALKRLDDAERQIVTLQTNQASKDAVEKAIQQVATQQRQTRTAIALAGISLTGTCIMAAITLLGVAIGFVLHFVR